MGISTQLVVVVILVVVTKGWWCYGCWEEERIALLQLKAFFTDPYEHYPSWGGDTDCCTWGPVQCDTTTRRVIKLSLRNTGDGKLDGWYLNASMFLPFEQLESLDLSWNGIAGCIENEGFERLSNLRRLEFLDLSFNRFDNSILSYLDSLSSLKSLNLRKNKLEGSIDIGALNNLTILTELILARNRIQGFKSVRGGEEFLKLSNLEVLHLRRNRFDKNILSRLKGLSALKSLDLGYNRLKGSINITGLNASRNLETLRLGGNEINGSTVLRGLPTLKNLEALDLRRSALINSSMILKTIGRMPNLRSLKLDECGLHGIIPEGLCQLKHLNELYIYDNDLDGMLPGCLANLTSLQTLDVSWNHLSGNISLSSLMSLTSIYDLRISNNNFQIPISLHPFFNFTKLKSFDAGQNQIYWEEEANDHDLTPKFQLEDLDLSGHCHGGALPKFLYHQRSLKYIDLSYTRIFEEIRSHFPRLTFLTVNRNSLSGSIPSSIGDMWSVELSNNQLHRLIPEYGSDCQLRFLVLSNNRISGGIPDSLSNCSSLMQLDIGNNSLSGRIPEWMRNMSNLEFLNLSGNKFSGILPYNFNPPSLRYVSLHGNNLQGSLINSFYNCSDLISLDLGSNNFMGGIPDWIGSLSGLSILILSYNNLEGEIPFGLCKLEGMIFVDLSHNNFSGRILPCIRCANSDALRLFFYPEESLVLTAKGASYVYKGSILQNMSGIDLSCNNLSGKIPHEFGELSDIKVLNLSHNSLTGEIPTTFSKLKQIETLDLSFNNLNGTIPPQLIELSFLSAFSVAHNNLCGKTPQRVGQFGTFDEDRYRDNPYLCGPPLKKSCSEIAAPPGRNATTSGGEGEEEGGCVDKGAFYVTFVASHAVAMVATCAVLYINPRWRRAMFYFLQQKFFNCCYFLMENVPLLSRLGLS